MKNVFYSIVLLMITSLTGCNFYHSISHKPPSLHEHTLQTAPVTNNSTEKTKAFAPAYYDKVVIDSSDKVLIKGKQLQSIVKLTGNCDKINHTTVQVKNNTLYVRTNSSYGLRPRVNSPLRIEIQTANDIHNIHFASKGELQTENIGDTGLTLDLGGDSVTQLAGNLSLQNITLSGHAILHAYWLNTGKIKVAIYEQAKLFLAGIATKLDITASGTSMLDAKYLRVEEAFVKASDHANVGINVKRAVNTWAKDYATVYNYRDAYFSSPYMEESGSSLRMLGIQ